MSPAEMEVRQLNLRYASLRIVDPARVSRLAASILMDGQRSPVLVVGHVLIDGYHRVAALEQLGRDLVSVMALELTEADALVLAWRFETGRRKTAIEEAWLLSELLETHGRTQASLARELGRTRGWVSERIALVRVLPESVQAAVREGRIPANAAMKSLVPMARLDREGCAHMVAALGAPVSVREVERLHAAWRQAEPIGQARILDNPTLLLQAEDAVTAVAPDAQERLVRDFEALTGICHRARRQAREGVFPRGNTSPARRSWDQAVEAFMSLQEEVSRAQPRDA